MSHITAACCHSCVAEFRSILVDIDPPDGAQLLTWSATGGVAQASLARMRQDLGIDGAW